MTTIKQLKIDLYRELLAKDISDLTDNELDIMYYLAEDEDVQEVLNQAAEKEKEEKEGEE